MIEYKDIYNVYNDIEYIEEDNDMNFLQKMAYKALTSNVELLLFMNDEEIKERVIQNGNNAVLRAFFCNYTAEEILDIIEQTMESND